MSALAAGGVVGLTVLAYLLWSDRHRLIETGRTARPLPHLPLLVALAGLVGLAAYLAMDHWPVKKTEPAPSQAVQFDLSCAKITTQKGKPAILTQCQGTLPTVSAPSQDKDPLSGKLELTFAALGIFIALVTAISLTVAKNATDEARRAEAQANDLHKEIDNIAQAQELAARLSLQRIEIQTTAQLARAPALASRLGINPTPLLEEKLKALDEMLRWQAPDFDADALARQTDTLVATMDNPNYRLHLNAFFDQRDAQACEGLIHALNKPAHGTLRPDHIFAARAIGRLLRRLRTN
ncbi:MAG: hypothetical protein IPM03_20040 [Sulfuritalea sp.]|nr:hypothetical protein [Sulfuritalea sp.]